MVYVDNYKVKFRGMIMSHMMADSEIELDAMASRLCLSVRWKQPGKGKRPPHYDVCESKRQQAILFGAEELTAIELGRRMIKDYF